MAYTYIQAIATGYPLVGCHAVGDGSIYEDIVWDSGAVLPSKAELDVWIAANPDPGTQISLTKYQFRKLFNLNERIAIDNASSNILISGQNRAILSTILKDLELSGVVELFNPDVISGVNFLEQLGLIDEGRASQILSNTPPI